MPRNRLPLAKAEASGAIYKNAGRFANRKTSKQTRALGEPYLRMTDQQKECWHTLAGEIPWLNSSHRALLRVCCTVMARLDSGEEVPIAALSLMTTSLSKLGATPVDETKVKHDDGDEDPDDQFFSRPN